jgi:hypothetical protein
MPSSGMLCRVAIVRTEFRSVLRLVVTVHFPSPPILPTPDYAGDTIPETSVLTKAYGVTSQETVSFIDTAVKTSDLT